MPVRVCGTEKHITALFDAEAVRFMHGRVVKFASGILSPGAYNDNRVLPTYPDPWAVVIEGMSDILSTLRSEFDVIASVATGGIVHGAVLASMHQRPHVIVKKEEKSHGFGGLIDGGVDVLRGARVLMIEDMSSTFGSALKAMAILEQVGATVAHTIAISTWGFPEFYKNVGEDHHVHVLVTGEQLINHAESSGVLPPRYADILQGWVKDPHDQTWRTNEWHLSVD